MRNKPLPPLEELKEYLDYNPDTGIFIWKKSNNGFIKGGRKAGSLNNNGYSRIQFMKNQVMLHRVAYYMHYGVDPLEKLVDQIDIFSIILLLCSFVILLIFNILIEYLKVGVVVI